MPDVSRLKFICSSFCTQYQSEAKFYIDEAHASGSRHLVVVYEKGGYAGHSANVQLLALISLGALAASIVTLPDRTPPRHDE